jgi:hypothetical protein
MSDTQSEVEDNVTESTVRDIVRDRCTPELEDEFVELAMLLSSVNFKGHLQELDVLYQQMDSEMVDPSEIIIDVDQILRIGAETALNNCGVEFDPDVPLSMLIEGCDILLKFDPTEFPQLVIDAIDAAEDSVETVMVLLDLLGTYSDDDWLPYISRVSDAFAKRVRGFCVETLEQDITDRNTSLATAPLLKRLNHLVKSNAESLGAEIGKADQGLGLTLESLYAQNVVKLMDSPVDVAVNNLFSLSVISNESFEGAMVGVAHWLDDLYYDAEMRREAEQLRMKLTSHYKPMFGDD